LPEPLSRPQSVGWTKFLARRQANVDLPRRHDSRLRSIFRKHARESALTSLGALLFHLVFGNRPRSRRTQSVERGSRFAIVIRLVVQQNGDAGLRESLSHSTDKSAYFQYSPHDGQQCQQSPSSARRTSLRSPPDCTSALRRPGMGINAISSEVGRYEIVCPSFSNSSRSA
jgi:hypothetical protein